MLHDVGTGAERWRVSDPALAQTMTFSPDHRWLAVAGARAPVRLYETETGRLAATMAGHRRSILALAFSPDGTQLASAGGDLTVRLWRVRDGAAIAILRGHEAEVSRLAWAPDGRTIFSASADGVVRQWTLPAQPVVHVVAGLWAQTLGGFLFLPPQNQVAVTDDTGAVSLYDADSLAFIRRIGELFQPLEWSEPDQAMVALSRDREFVRYDPITGVVTRLGVRVPGEERVLAPTATADGSRVAVATFGGEVTLADLRTGRSVPTAEKHAAQVDVIAFAPDGRTAASADASGVLNLWDAADGALLRHTALGGFAITALAFSPDGQRIVAGNDRGEILVMRAGDGVVQTTFSGHNGAVACFTWSPDGTRLVSGGDDGFVSFWATEPFRRLASIPVVTPSVPTNDQGICIVRFSSDGTKFGAFTGDGRLRVWPLR